MQRFAWSATFFAVPCRQLPCRGAAQLLLLRRGMANKDSELGQQRQRTWPTSWLFLINLPNPAIDNNG